MGISLNQINAEADKRFQQFVVDDVPGGQVVLRNAIRLQKSERAQLVGMNKAIVELKASAEAGEFDEDEMLDLVGKFFDVVAIGDGGKRLVDALDGDLAKLMVLMEMYAEDTQLGEALRSAS